LLKAAERLATTCPWFFESHPVAFMLVHKWMKYFRPHDFGYSRWKYLSVDPELRDATRNAFSPISLTSSGADSPRNSGNRLAATFEILLRTRIFIV
jgi:hypothetical protein